VRALGDGVTGFAAGEHVVSLSGTGSGGYAAVHVGPAYLVASTEGYDLDPALVVSVPNAAMAHVAFTRVLHLAEGESVLVHGALGASRRPPRDRPAAGRDAGRRYGPGEQASRRGRDPAAV